MSKDKLNGSHDSGIMAIINRFHAADTEMSEVQHSLDIVDACAAGLEGFVQMVEVNAREIPDGALARDNLLYLAKILRSTATLSITSARKSLGEQQRIIQKRIAV